VERQRKTGNLSNQFAELLAAAGLRRKKNHKSTGKGRGKRRNVEPLSFHSLRRTATTLLHEGGVPSAVAQALIGHDTEAMHELYISVGREALEKARQLFPRSEGSVEKPPLFPVGCSRLAFCFFCTDRTGTQAKDSQFTGLLVRFQRGA
jgi:hypothetical protein